MAADLAMPEGSVMLEVLALGDSVVAQLKVIILDIYKL